MLFENKEFESDSLDLLEKGTYEECIFKNCDFTNHSLAFFKFENCHFESCNLSNISLNGTTFQDCEFLECKLTGISFEDVNPFLFGIKCNSCDFSLAFFAENDLTRSAFIGCNFRNAQFIEVDAKGVDFTGSDFLHSVFEQSNFSEANFSEIVNLSMDISKNKVRKMKINQANLAGLLDGFHLNIID